MKNPASGDFSPKKAADHATLSSNWQANTKMAIFLYFRLEILQAQ